MRNPAGAICRNDRRGVSSAGESPGPVPALIATSGLASQLPGSVGRLSRPATVKLLNSPPANDAQSARKLRQGLQHSVNLTLREREAETEMRPGAVPQMAAA